MAFQKSSFRFALPAAVINQSSMGRDPAEREAVRRRDEPTKGSIYGAVPQRVAPVFPRTRRLPLIRFGRPVTVPEEILGVSFRQSSSTKATKSSRMKGLGRKASAPSAKASVRNSLV